jgi:hypothetical protein
MQFKEWLLKENTIAQELKKLPPDQLDKNMSNANDIFKSIFNFDIDSKKSKEIKDWIAYFLKSHLNLREILNQNIDFLYTNYNRINFKTSEYTPEKLIIDSEDYHENLKKNTKVGSKGAYGKTLISFPDKWKWVSLQKGYCPIEAQAMGHCGNVAGQANPKHNILSLRDPRNVPYLTFIDEGNGVLGEMKAKFNNKPDQKFHPYILELLLHPSIKKIKGGGYAPENNFEIIDLNDNLYQKLMVKKPSINYKPQEIFDEIIKTNSRNYPYHTQEFDITLINSIIQNNLINSNGKFTSTTFSEKDKDMEEYYKKILQNDKLLIITLLLKNGIKPHLELQKNTIKQFKNPVVYSGRGGYHDGHAPDDLQRLVIVYSKFIDLFDPLFNLLNQSDKSRFVYFAVKAKQKLSDKLYKHLNYYDTISLEDNSLENNIKLPPEVSKIVEKYKDLYKREDQENNDITIRQNTVFMIYRKLQNIINGNYSYNDDAYNSGNLNKLSKLKIPVRKKLLNEIGKYLKSSSVLVGNGDIIKWIAADLSGLDHGTSALNYGPAMIDDIEKLLHFYIPYLYKSPELTEYLIKIASYFSHKHMADKKQQNRINSLINKIKYSYTKDSFEDVALHKYYDPVWAKYKF